MIGIDEVGRGCWAGPLLVVAARQTGKLPAGLKDSKLLSRKKRSAVFDDIKIACDLGEGWVSAEEIDAIGLSNAMRLGVERALTAIKPSEHEEIIMDGSVNYCATGFTHVRCEAKADSKYPLVSAASIYAKVMRDDFMSNLEVSLSHYKFEKHVGYGTKLHMDMLERYGVSEIHRQSFAPIAARLKG